jgi:hypothetical protein
MHVRSYADGRYRNINLIFDGRYDVRYDVRFGVRRTAFRGRRTATAIIEIRRDRPLTYDRTRTIVRVRRTIVRVINDRTMTYDRTWRTIVLDVRSYVAYDRPRRTIVRGVRSYATYDHTRTYDVRGTRTTSVYFLENA